MPSTPYESLVAYILTIDRAVVLYLLVTNALFSFALVSWFARRRRWLELLSLYLITFVVLFVLAGLLFTSLLDRPFVRLETIALP